MEESFQRIGFYIKVIENQLRTTFNSTLKAYDLTKPQFDMLIFLARYQDQGVPVSQRDLETLFHISNPTVSNMLRRMENKGLIVRTTCEHDRRIRYVRPTDKALSLICEVSSKLKEQRRHVFDGMSKEEIESCTNFLKHLLFNLTGKEENELDFDFNQPD